MKADAILLRYGEVALKSDHVRRRMEDRLLGNIRSGLDKAKIEYTLRKELGRIFVETKQVKEAVPILRRIFGLVSLSPVKTVVVGSSLEKICKTAVSIGKQYIKKTDKFALRARRTGNNNFTSKMIEREAGGRVQDVTKAKVDLDNPDKTLHVEVRQNKAYFYIENYPCYGGLPLGTQGKVVVLFSGGMDSAVAAWLMMKRGCSIVPLYLDDNPYTDKATTQRALKTFEALKEWTYGWRTRLNAIENGKNIFMISEDCKGELAAVLVTRMALRIAEQVAIKEGARAIVTGDNLNEGVAQSLEAMPLLGTAKIPVLRPVLTWDKKDIQEKAKEIGILEAAEAKVKDYRPPRQRIGPLEEIEREEKKLKMEKLLEVSLATMKAID